MGNDEANKSSKSDKASSPMPEQTNTHVYPDWAAFQAYYGHGVTLPPPYFNSAFTSGHAPHPYMWPPQPVMPPYGAAYSTMYPHGGVCTHPTVPLVKTATSSEAPVKSLGNPDDLGNTDRGPLKKLKGFDGIVVSIGDGNVESIVGGTVLGLSQSVESGTEGSNDGSDGNTTGVDQTRRRKRSCEGTPSTVGIVPSVSMTTLVERRSSSEVSSKKKSSLDVEAKIGTSSIPSGVGPTVSSQVWVKNERALKREKRKQSNRESARRSRLRKQAETEELAVKAESLNAENVSLRSEINQLTEKSEKLRLENVALMEKLKNAQQEVGKMDRIEKQGAPSISTENFLSRVDNLGSGKQSPEPENETLENNSNPETKLHQLLESSPRADAIAAG